MITNQEKFKTQTKQELTESPRTLFVLDVKRKLTSARQDTHIRITNTHLQLAAGPKAGLEKSFPAFAFFRMRTIVYVDGFNLYYRMLKQQPTVKWVNPLALARTILHNSHDIVRVNYYIARVSSRAHDPDAPARQAVYLKALGTVPEIRIHEGNFLTSETWMPLASPPDARPHGYGWNMPPPVVVRVVKSEEKGSDVNLGAHLVRDAFTNAFDVGVVITNDSDLAEPIRIATNEAGKRVGLLKPVENATQSLVDASSWHLHIRYGHLRQAQFPNPIVAPDGSQIIRPASWA